MGLRPNRRHDAALPLFVFLLATIAFGPSVASAGPVPQADDPEPPAGANSGATAAADPARPGTTSAAEALGTPLSPLDVIRESLFGESSSDDWTPLSWRTLLTEGWDQPFVFSPASDSGALRQEWINAANGVFYRQWVLDYIYRNHVGTKGDQHLGSWFIFAPLNRRFEVLFTVPFVDYRRVDNSRVSSVPGTGGGGVTGGRGSGHPGPYRANFGDLSITPQVLLHETRNTSIMSIMTIRTPTGNPRAGNGVTSLGPQLQFWQGLPNRWVVRGSVGTTVPLDATGSRTTLDTNLTVGKFLTLEEVRYFKEFTVYLAANVSTSLDRRGSNDTTLTLLPGRRFRVTPDVWFLSGVETSPIGSGREDYALFFRLVKRY